MNKKLLYTLLGGALLVSSPLSAQTINNQHKGKGTAQWKFNGGKHKSLQVDTERTFHQRYPLAML